MTDDELDRKMRAHNARESEYWHKYHFGCRECGRQGMGHHPSCSSSVGPGEAEGDERPYTRGGGIGRLR